jgi:glutaminase
MHSKTVASAQLLFINICTDDGDIHNTCDAHYSIILMSLNTIFKYKSEKSHG